MTVLHVGCGRKRLDAEALFRYVGLQMATEDVRVIHLDANPSVEPDLVCTLGRDAIPLPDDSVDLIVAWHVLEHVGRQGESGAWFRCWEELYRVLAPSGWLYGESPYYTSIWAWSDPTHTRALSEHSFVFFAQDSYRVPDSAISPYRLRCDFQWLGLGNMPRGFEVITQPQDARVTSLRFAMAPKKPLQPWWET